MNTTVCFFLNDTDITDTDDPIEERLPQDDKPSHLDFSSKTKNNQEQTFSTSLIEISGICNDSEDENLHLQMLH